MDLTVFGWEGLKGSDIFERSFRHEGLLGE